MGFSYMFFDILFSTVLRVGFFLGGGVEVGLISTPVA